MKLIACALATLLVAGWAAALVPLPGVTTVTHTYDEFSGNGTPVGTFYPGFTYSGDDEVYCSYNSGDYPGSTPPCVVLPVSSGTFTIAADDPSTYFGQYEADVATDGNTVTFDGYDDVGTLVASTSCSSADATYAHCVLSSPTAMASVTISGPADFYILDTSVFTPSQTPSGVSPHVVQNPDGTCDVYNDQNGNGVEDPGENVATVPCALPTLPNYQVSNNGDGTCTVYNDQNGNGQVDPGEAVTTVPCSVTLPNPQVANNGDGTCTVYDDQNGNGQVDPGEAITTVPCSAPASIPVGVPPASESVPIPAVFTPNVPSETVTTPGVTTPATCTVSVCTSPTTVGSQQVGPTPDVPAQSTPPLPQACVPLVICIGPVPPQPLTPEVPPQGPVSTPPETAPAVCSAASFLCVPATPILPPEPVTTPGEGPMQVTPPVIVSVSTTGFDGLVTPNAGQFSSIGPFNEQVGPVPVTLCPSTCPVPVPPGATLDGSITVTVLVGAEVHSVTIPVHV
jgi:hypothetical protein